MLAASLGSSYDNKKPKQLLGPGGGVTGGVDYEALSRVRSLGHENGVNRDEGTQNVYRGDGNTF